MTASEVVELIRILIPGRTAPVVIMVKDTDLAIEILMSLTDKESEMVNILHGTQPMKLGNA